jgi:RNA polymerase sigma factor (sigma-70 family)
VGRDSPVETVRESAIRPTDLAYESYKASSDKRDEFYKTLYDHAQRLVGMASGECLPEVANEAITRVFKHLAKFNGKSRFSTWFTRIVLNCLNDHMTARAKKREVPMSELAEAGNAREEPVSVESLDLSSFAGELDPEDRQFLQWKISGETETYISKQTGLSLAGVRSKWHRMRGKLLERLG